MLLGWEQGCAEPAFPPAVTPCSSTHSQLPTFFDIPRLLVFLLLLVVLTDLKNNSYTVSGGVLSEQK